MECLHCGKKMLLAGTVDQSTLRTCVHCIWEEDSDISKYSFYSYLDGNYVEEVIIGNFFIKSNSETKISIVSTIKCCVLLDAFEVDFIDSSLPDAFDRLKKLSAF